MIYLDNAATTYPKPESVYQAMDWANREIAVNAGRGSYKLAREATKLIGTTKVMLKKLVCAPEFSKVIFTPSATIAINQILGGIEFKENDIIYVSPYEHNAVARVLNFIVKKRKIIIRELPLKNSDFEIDIEKMKYQFSKEHPVCVCCTHVSNVTGYILPIKEIFEVAREYGAITVLDAAQSMGLIQMDLKEIQADFVAFAGHKTLYASFGIAGFMDVSGIDLGEYIVGGTGSDSLNLEMPQVSPNKYESASSNIIAIAGLKASLENLNVLKIFEQEKEMTQYLINQLVRIKGIVLYLPKDLQNSHIGIVSFNLEGYKAEDIGMILDEDFDIAVRTGYHCAPFIHKYLNDEKYLGTVRIGVGQFTTREQVDVVIKSLQEIIKG